MAERNLVMRRLSKLAFMSAQIHGNYFLVLGLRLTIEKERVGLKD
jgi:hypothetical protein